MRLRLFLVSTLSILVLASLGCSSDGDSAKDKGGDEAAQAKTPMTRMDSLAMKTYPIRNEDNKLVTIETDHGKMVLELYRDVAPAHADSFAARAAEGFYDSLTIHRIIPNFMLQGGDPSGNGTGRADYLLNAEFSDLPHQEGTLSMARGNNPNSASCQFFVCFARSRSCQNLDGKYTVFGQLISGFEVLHQIEAIETTANPFGEKSTPVEKVVIKKVYLSDADGNPVSEG